MRRFLWGAALAFVGACGSDGPATFDGGNDGSGGDAQGSFTLRVDPATDSETVTIGLQNKTVQFHAFRKDSPLLQSKRT